MCAVILIFAFLMSLAINLGEKIISSIDEQHARPSDAKESMVAESVE